MAAAKAFLATLDASQKAKLQFAAVNNTQKANWSNLPQGRYQRASLEADTLNSAQQNAWLALMQTTQGISLLIRGLTAAPRT